MLTLSRLGSYMAKNQYGDYIGDDEFIEKWRAYPSPTALAEHLGIGVRAVMNRRRSVEIRQNITLVTDLSYKQESFGFLFSVSPREDFYSGFNRREGFELCLLQDARRNHLHGSAEAAFVF